MERLGIEGGGGGGEVTVHTRGHDSGSEGDGHLQGRVMMQRFSYILRKQYIEPLYI